MVATILQSHEIATRMLNEAASQVQARLGRAPCLALLATEAASAGAYLRRIEEYAGIVGIDARRIDLPSDMSTDAALAVVSALNSDAAVDGVLMLMPLPAEVSVGALAEVLDPAKDVDGMTPVNAGRLMRGLNGLFPCTPQAALALAEEIVGSVRGLRVTVVGASLSVGRPLADMLLQRGATVTVAHADTIDLVTACHTAEVLFVAVGKAGLIDSQHVADGAIVIDIGINIVSDAAGCSRIVGDVDLESIRLHARAVSAVPDGVGPLTTAFLIRNTLASAGCTP